MQVKRSLAVAAMLVTVAASTASGAVKTREVDYKQAGTGTPLKGMIAWDDAKTGKRPGVLVVHEWWGLNEHARNAARKLAEAGYVGFALDLYGNGKSTEHQHDAEGMMNQAMGDPAAIKARFDAALDQLKQDPHVDTTKLAAIGYCMGGAVVLNMARAGEDLKAVVSFHGILQTQAPAEKGKVKARVLALAGDSDSFVPMEQVEAFKKEMAAADVKSDVVVYKNTKHGFTNPDAAKYGMPQLAYNATAAKESWDAMLKLFKDQDVFGV
jgi:dienelactone hydrolase